MPNGSHYEYRPTLEEIIIEETSENIIYVKEQLGLKVHAKERGRPTGTTGYYKLKSHADYLVSELCSLITNMNEEQLERIVYNAKDKQSRRVADWWEEHLEADRRRVAEEEAKKQKQRLKSQVLKKLTKIERKALDL
jgi:hypothetical protein